MNDRPNVVFVLTDDQGYADLGCTGNPWIKTPNIDAFYEDCVRFNDYHVQPLCTPTRGTLMSGRRPVRNGAWATCWGRSILRRTETAMADFFRASGYSTGMFGKWHLGDNYPYRPQDRGFETVVAHKGGGVGQTPDYWGNNYFNDTYFHNSSPVEHTGYCTDIWFTEAMCFIQEHQDEPFFCYIATNAPHAPYLVAEKYRALYQDNPDIPEPAFYGMITNIDEQFGKLQEKLDELELSDNTVLIFMTDNGSSGGCTFARRGASRVERGYNAGMRGKKGSYYDGGHRVPFFIRWPARELTGGRDIEEMALGIDVLPTLIDLCGLETRDEDVQFDGTSLAGLLNGDITELPERYDFLNIIQSTDPPQKHRGAVLSRRWRLVHGSELYDIKADPGQENDVAEQFPDVVRDMSSALDEWWGEITPELEQICAISIGNDNENPTVLTAMDVMGDVTWNHMTIAAARKSSGEWRVDIEQPGKYEFRLRRWPQELVFPVDEALSGEAVRELAPYPGFLEPKAIRPMTGRLTIFDETIEKKFLRSSEEMTFELNLLTTGETRLRASFITEEGEEFGAYYVVAERLGKDGKAAQTI